MSIAIGIDIHKKTSTFYALQDDGEPWTEFNQRFRRVPSNPDGYREVMFFIGSRDCDFLMENSTKTHDSYWTLRALGFDNLYVAHSTDLKQITKSDKKNDDNDAMNLATYMRVRRLNVNQFRCCYICTPDDMRRRMRSAAGASRNPCPHHRSTSHSCASRLRCRTRSWRPPAAAGAAAGKSLRSG